LKPENILIDNQGHLRLIDFGFAKIMDNIKTDRTKTNCGTPGYAAPEILMGIEYNYKVDIWSIGILICEMVGGFTPFSINDGESSPYNFAK
jgi:serine/threonine protein kinase